MTKKSGRKLPKNLVKNDRKIWSKMVQKRVENGQKFRRK